MPADTPTPGDASSDCPGLAGPFSGSHDWRSLGDGLLRCGYCPATKPENPHQTNTHTR